MNAAESLDVEVREYTRLFKKAFPGKDGHIFDDYLKDSKLVFKTSKFPKVLAENMTMDSKF